MTITRGTIELSVLTAKHSTGLHAIWCDTVQTAENVPLQSDSCALFRRLSSGLCLSHDDTEA